MSANEEARMAVGKVTISALAKLDGWLWDTHVTGFGARRQTNGVFYYVRYRHAGQQTVRSIGRHGPWTPDTARAKALQLLGEVAGGSDPFAQELAGEGFAAALDRYLARKQGSLKLASFTETERYLRLRCTPLHSLRLDQIDRRKIAALLGEVETAYGPASRNRARSALSAFYTWAIQEGLVDVSPVAGTGKANEGGSRERVLSPEEIKALWRALGDDRFSDIVRLLLLTGQRRNEISKLRWSEVDLTRRVIVLAPERTKNSRQHELPLSSQALAIIERQPRRNSSYFLFAERGFANWDRGKAKLDQRAGIAPWRLHDLRRTCATQLGELGVQPHHIEAILNHYSGHRAGVAGVYQRARYEPEIRAALQRWADHIDQITGATK
jgi:integrase